MNAFKIGDRVTFINDYGVRFEGKTITGTETWPHSQSPTETRYFFTPTAAPWFSSPARNFQLELTPIGEQLVIPGCERNLAPSKRQLDLF